MPNVRGGVALLHEADWEAFFEALSRKTGLDLRQHQPEQLRRRIRAIVQSCALDSLHALWERLESDPAELRRFLERLSVNVCGLFHDLESWHELENTVFPELLSRRTSLKVWCAGCSNGAEAYAIASLLDARYPGAHRVVGTDVDAAVIAQADRGVFADSELTHVPEDVRRRYFQPFQEGWRADLRLRRYLSFRKHNLLTDAFESSHDLILCRNVTLFLAEETRMGLFQRLFAALRPGGFLFVGSTERNLKAESVGFEAPLPLFYRRPAEPDTWLLAA